MNLCFYVANNKYAYLHTHTDFSGRKGGKKKQFYKMQMNKDINKKRFENYRYEKIILKLMSAPIMGQYLIIHGDCQLWYPQRPKTSLNMKSCIKSFPKQSRQSKY